MMYLQDMNNVVCYGYGVNQTVIDLQEKKIRFVSGRTFTQNEIDQGAYVTIVSKEFVEENKKQIHDTIKMKIACPNTECNELGKIYEEEYDLEIVGIFEKIDKAFDINHTGFGAIQNRMYLPNQTLWNIFERKSELHNKYMNDAFDYIAIDVPFIRLKNSESLDDFENEVETWLPKNNQEKLVVSNDEFLKVSSQVQILEKIGILLIVGSIVAGIFFLIILMLITIKERLREIGILLMLGERKYKVIIQILFENLMMNVIGISLSLICGNFIWKFLNQSIFRVENVTIISFNVQIIRISIMIVLLSMIYPILKIMNLRVKKIVVD